MSVKDVLSDHEERGKIRKDLQDVLQCADVTLAIECSIEMVEMEFFNVTKATDEHNEDSEGLSQ